MAEHAYPPTKRLDDPRLLRGQGQYVADLRRPDLLHMAVFRNPYPHARLRALDVEAARRAPGVAAVITAADVAATAPMPVSEVPQPDFAKALHLQLRETEVRVLAGDRLRHAGEPVAVVVAESRAEAEDARDLIVLDAEPLPAVGGENALTGPELYDGVVQNVAVALSFERGQAPDQAAAAPAAGATTAEASGRAHGESHPATGACTVRTRFFSCRQGGSAIETRGALAVYDAASDSATLWTSTQIPHRVRKAVTTILGWPEDRLRVITPDVGGGFGMKTHIAGEEALVVYCARLLGRPVRWIADRGEDLLAAAQARDQIHDAELDVDAEGRILSFRDDYLTDLGASSSRTVGIVANSALHAFGPYKMPHISIRGRGVLSNKPPSAQYRGAGRPEMCFALERALDIAARKLGLDPFEIRRRNFIQPQEMPFAQGVPQRDGVPIRYDASNYPAVLEQALQLAQPSSWPALRAETEARGERFGVGCAAYMEATGRGPSEGARLRVEPDGGVHIFTGAAGSGQGHATTLAKVCAAVLDIPLERISLTEGDTGLMPDGVGTFASRTAVVAGNAVHQASLDLREHAMAVAADRLRVPPSQLSWRKGAAHSAEGRSTTLAELAAGYETEFHFRPDTVTWTMGLAVALVAVDPATGGVRIVRYVNVHDGGPSLDETIVEGQMQGGVVQGISGGLLEEFVFDADGQPQAVTMADYMIAGAMEAPDVLLGHVEALGSNPLGIKGVGESGTVPAPAALANAISDALGGAELNSLPLKPSAIWLAASGRIAA